VVNFLDATISAFSINPTVGTLTDVSDYPFGDPGGYPSSIAVDPTGAFVDVTNSTMPGSISVYAITQGSGALMVVAYVKSRDEATEIGRRFMEIHLRISGASFKAVSEIQEMFPLPVPERK